MPFVALLDANVLYPAQLRDLLLSQAMTGVFQARWSHDILDETFEAIRRNKPEISAERLLRTRALMCHAIEDCLVEDYSHLISALDLPDPNDHHVLAAAIVGKARVIVTYNVRDFPESALAPYGIEVKSPDRFLLETMEMDPGRFVAAVARLHARLRNPPKTLAELVDDFDRTGLIRTASNLREAFNL
jgi:predicted nucleic acid-binding protein